MFFLWVYEAPLVNLCRELDLDILCRFIAQTFRSYRDPFRVTPHSYIK